MFLRQILILFILLFFISHGFSQEPNNHLLSIERNLQVGLDFPTYGLAKIKPNAIIGYYGFNLLLGYSSLNYFDPLKANQWNPFWHWGTVVLLVPYIGIGSEYQNENGFYFSAKTIYMIPFVSFGFRF